MSHRHSHSRLSDVEEFLALGALLWLALSALAWLLRRPKLWPLIALVCVAAHCSGAR